MNYKDEVIILDKNLKFEKKILCEFRIILERLYHIQIPLINIIPRF